MAVTHDSVGLAKEELGKIKTVLTGNGVAKVTAFFDGDDNGGSVAGVSFFDSVDKKLSLVYQHRFPSWWQCQDLPLPAKLAELFTAILPDNWCKGPGSLGDITWEVESGKLEVVQDRRVIDYEREVHLVSIEEDGNGLLNECQNCGCIWQDRELKPIKDLEQRVATGEIMPAGECPNCSALCHQLSDG